MAEQFDSQYFSGQGPTFIGHRDSSGNPAGLVFVGDMSAVEATPNIDRTDIYENVTGNRNVAASFKTQTEYALRLVMKSAKPAHLAQAIGGTVTTKASSSVTDESVKGYHDKFTPLEHVKISSVVITGSGGTPTYVADTDYVVHAAGGMIEVLSTGSISDGADLLVDYSYADQKHVKANPSDTDLVLIVDGLNRARSDKRGRLTLYKVNLDPGFLNAIQDGDEETPMELTGKLLLDDLRSAGDQLFSWQIED